MNRLLLIFLGLILVSEFTWALDPEMARVVTFRQDVAKCLAPIEIKTIDGKNRMLPRFGFDIEPGWHTMHGTVTVNLKRCPVYEESGRNRRPHHVEPLEWLFERGKIYYVGFDHSSPNRENWRIIVWKVESMDSGEEEEEAGLPQ